MAKKNLAVIIIAWNEESQISACLDSVSGFAPVYLLLDNCTDKTEPLAKNYNFVRLYHYPVKGRGHNFADLRNFISSKVKADWLFYLDADERLTDSLKSEISAIIRNPPKNFAAAAIPRYNYFFGQRVRFGGTYPDYVVRFFLRSRLVAWKGRLHEQPDYQGNLYYLSSALLHYTHRDLTTMLEKTNDWTKKEAELLYFAHHPPVVPWRLFRMMLTKFIERVIRQQAWRDGTVGWINSIFEIFDTFIIYARLWELQQKNPKKP